MPWTNYAEACARLEARAADLEERKWAADQARAARVPTRQAVVAAFVRQRMGRYADPALEARDELVVRSNQRSLSEAEWTELNERSDAILKAMGAWWLPPVNED